MILMIAMHVQNAIKDRAINFVFVIQSFFISIMWKHSVFKPFII